MTSTDYMCQVKKEEVSFEDSVDASRLCLEDYIKKHEGRLIRNTRINTDKA